MWHPYRPLAGLLATDLTRDMGSGMEGPNIQRDHRWTGHVRRRIVRRGKPRPQKFTGKQGSGSGAPHGVVEPSAPDWCYAQPRSIASNSVLYCGRRGTCVEVALKLVGSCWSGCALVEGTQAHGGLGGNETEPGGTREVLSDAPEVGDVFEHIFESGLQFGTVKIRVVGADRALEGRKFLPHFGHKDEKMLRR
jgi:hypothetical protein